MIVKPLSAETSLTTATSVSSASVVRLYNKGTADHKITNDATNGEFTMPAGSITFMPKSPADTISTDNTGSEVLATSVAYLSS